MAKSNKGRKFFATTATAALVASAIVPVASAAQINDFNSISSYAQEAVQDLNDRGVIKGDQKGNFNPKSAITRAEAATILANALELEGSGSTSFTDVKKSAWYYNAIDAAVANGIFQGQGAGKFNPSANLTRSEAAIILVDAFGLEGSADLSTFKDSASVKSWAEEALSIAVENGVMKGDDNGNLKPNASITRQDFALMYYRTEGVEGTEEVSGSVKAINNTTVEVTFTEEVLDIKALDFAIEGLEVTNAVVKQTNSKVVVLTTSAQTADVDYKVSVNGEAVGSFKGIGAVIPTSIKVETTSVQSKVGAQVTLKATTTPGAQVTFNVQATGNSLNENKKVEVTAGTDGVATYSYTQYGVAGVDNVTVYPTGAPSLLDYAKVYWGKEQILTVDADAKTVDNGANRVYKVVYKDPTTGAPVQNAKLNVTFKENLNDIDGSKTNDSSASIRKDNGTYVTPYQDTTATAGTNREEAFQVVTNSLGEATFILTGKNTNTTPVVFADANTNNRFDATELQVEAGATKFQGVQSPYTITFERTADFVAALSNEHGQENPISYKLKVNTDKKDKDGNPIPYKGATIKVAIQQNQDSTLTNNTPAQIASSDNGPYTTDGVVSVITDDKGEATVSLKSAVDNSKATPLAWIDLNTAGNNATVGNDKLEDGEPNAVGPTVTFLKSVVVAPAYTLNTASAGAFINGDTMTWKASLNNQSGNVSETAGVRNATYTITNTSNSIQTIKPQLVDAAGNAYQGLTITYNGRTQTQPFTNGSAVKLEPNTTVTIHGIAPGLRNQYTNTNTNVSNTTSTTTTELAEYSTTNDALLKVVAPNDNGQLSVSANVTTVRKQVTDDIRNNNNTYTYDAKVADYIKSTLIADNTATVTGTVIGYELRDANRFERTEWSTENPTTFGRLVIKEQGTGTVKHYYYKGATIAPKTAEQATDFSTLRLGDVSFTGADNALTGADQFENLLSINDEVQVNAAKSTGAKLDGSGVDYTNTTGKEVRLYNKDNSSTKQASGNKDYTAPAAVPAPVVTYAVVSDTDNNGAVDTLELRFDKAIDKSTLEAGDFRLSATNVATTTAYVSGKRDVSGSANGNVLKIEFDNTTFPVNSTVYFEYAKNNAVGGNKALTGTNGQEVATQAYTQVFSVTNLSTAIAPATSIAGYTATNLPTNQVLVALPISSVTGASAYKVIVGGVDYNLVSKQLATGQTVYNVLVPKAAYDAAAAAGTILVAKQ